ncbi:DUF1579 domain-containing protein [Dyella sp. SG609]|uniref:DUF1579 domain-containing protein n=1 Tax=Dyella sp. SG609 TaxID=2587018 RepID=UPI001444A66B|nr:DUF1579 domain-containing protein [Dyella sp. SG609]NKJ19715.1 hypothetical protein [Dyella sp. SG609]
MREIDTHRRQLLQWTLASLPALPTMLVALGGLGMAPPAAAAASGAHDFDFFLGNWRVHHRRLRKRLAGSRDWDEFEGSSRCQALLGGLVNVNESESRRGGQTYNGLGIRAYDAASGLWADWYLDGGKPTSIEAAGSGRFAGGVGTFLADETFEGKPVKVRGIFTPVTADTCQWEQAFSPDEGRSWETNWIMRYTRV